MLESLGHVDTWVALLTLTSMEIVLGIDNIIFIAILVARVPAEVRERTRKFGLLLALVTRLLLLFALSWLMGLTEPLFTLPIVEHPTSGRDLILGIGGMFLIGKSAHEMYEKLEGPEEAEPTDASRSRQRAQVAAVLVQIAFLDIVFSLDSVITAVGMAQDLWVMVAAMLISVGVMLAFARRVGEFVDRHPSIKILALSFLLLIGSMLVAEGTGQHVSKGYIYFAMAFAVGVELLNMRLRNVQKPVQLHGGMPDEPSEAASDEIRT